MAELFNDLSQFKAALGGAVNTSFSVESVEPYIFQAARKHLTPIISQDLYDELGAAEKSGNPSAAQLLLFPYVRRALAWLTMYEYFPVAVVQMSDTGLTRSENEHKKTAYKYQENAYRDTMLENGYEAIEHLVNYLEAKKADFPRWLNSSERAKMNDIFLNNATLFRLHYSKYVSRYTFEQLRALIEDVQVFAIESTFPAQAYADLKTKFAASTLSIHETNAVEFIQKAMCNFVIAEAMTRNLFVVKGNRLIQYEGLEPQTNTREGQPLSNIVGVAKRLSDIWANRHMSYLKKYITDNIAEFSLFWNVESGGTNTDADAWTTEEEETTTDLTYDPADPYCATTKTTTGKLLRF